MLISAIVPHFNEEGCVRPLRDSLRTALSGMGTDFEIVPVNDGSTDETEAALDRAGESDAAVNAIHLRHNGLLAEMQIRTYSESHHKSAYSVKITRNLGDFGKCAE